MSLKLVQPCICSGHINKLTPDPDLYIQQGHHAYAIEYKWPIYCFFRNFIKLNPTSPETNSNMGFEKYYAWINERVTLNRK